MATEQPTPDWHVEPHPCQFWDDLAQEMRDPEFAAEYRAAHDLISTLDGIANANIVPDPLRWDGDDT